MNTKMTLFKSLLAIACLAFAVSASACPKSAQHDDCSDDACPKITKVNMPAHVAAEDNCSHAAGECNHCQHCSEGGPCADDCATCRKSSKTEAAPELIADTKTEHKACSKSKAHTKGECAKC